MKIQNVRISSITVKNFKNVVAGNLDLHTSKEHGNASILGLYGQNGSGKTALIDTIELLQYLLCGRSVPDKFADYINIDAETASIYFEFCVGELVASYSFEITSVLDDTEQNTQYTSGNRKKYACSTKSLNAPCQQKNKTELDYLSAHSQAKYSLQKLN